MPAVAPSVSSSPSTTGLKAPEGSKEREAAERAARASATPRPAKTAVASPATPEATTSPAPALGSGAPEGTAAREAAERAGTGHRSQEAGERLFGVNTESTGLVALALAASVVLLVLVLGVPSGRWLRTVALAVAAFTGAATALDVREVLHQHDLGQTGLAAAAGGVALLHLLGLLAAGALFVRSDS